MIGTRECEDDGDVDSLAASVTHRHAFIFRAYLTHFIHDVSRVESRVAEMQAPIVTAHFRRSSMVVDRLLCSLVVFAEEITLTIYEMRCQVVFTRITCTRIKSVNVLNEQSAAKRRVIFGSSGSGVAAMPQTINTIFAPKARLPSPGGRLPRPPQTRIGLLAVRMRSRLRVKHKPCRD